MNLKTALALVKERGYLNQFSTPADCWFVAHRIPGGEASDAAEIPTKTAFRLIDAGLVERAGWGNELVNRGGVGTVWYTAKPTQTSQAAAK